MAIISMNSFWSDLGVSCGNQNANNWYDCFYGLTFSDGFVCANATDFFNHLGYSRYEFFKSYNGIDNEYEFYKNTDDVNIYDFKTFYEYAPSYIPSNCSNPPNTKFIIAYRNGSTPYRSEDGINWTTITTNSMSDYLVNTNCNAKSNVYYLMGGTNNVIRYNMVNNTWTNFVTTITLNDLAYNSDTDEFIGITRNASTNNVHISSDNGQSWTTYSSGLLFDCIGYSNNNYLYYVSRTDVGGKRVATSPDGITWTSKTVAGGGFASSDNKYFDSIDVNGDIIFIPSSATTGSKYFIETSDLVNFNVYAYNDNINLRVGTYNPNNSKQAYLGETNAVGLHGSVNGLVQSNAPTTYQYTDVEYFNNADIMVAGTRTSDINDTNRKLLYSLDNGLTWVKIDDTTGNISNILTIE